jgi:hypothetical protein
VTDPLVPGLAIQAISKIGIHMEDPSRALGLLFPCLKAGWTNIPIESERGMGEIGLVHPDATLDFLEERIRSEDLDSDYVNGITYVLGYFGRRRRERAQSLIESLEPANGYIRKIAIENIKSDGPTIPYIDRGIDPDAADFLGIPLERIERDMEGMGYYELLRYVQHKKFSGHRFPRRALQIFGIAARSDDPIVRSAALDGIDMFGQQYPKLAASIIQTLINQGKLDELSSDVTDDSTPESVLRALREKLRIKEGRFGV